MFSSCTIKKRAYRKGYYVEWNHHHSAIANTESKKPAVQIEPKQENVAKSKQEKADNNSEPALIAFSNKIIAQGGISIKRKSLFSKDGCGDIIIMKNGDEVKCKVTEINETEVQYKRCDNLDGPIVIVKKQEIFKIKYANGSEELIVGAPEVTKSPQKPNTIQHPKTEGNAITGFVFSMLALIIFLFMCIIASVSIEAGGVGFVFGLFFLILLGFVYFLFALLGIILGGVALNAISDNKKNLLGRNLAIASVVIGIIEVLALMVFMVIVMGAL